MSELFASYTLNEEGKRKVLAVTNAFEDLLAKLHSIGPSTGVPYAMVRMNLEQACFYAKKAIAMIPANRIREGQ